eukprot:3791936-Amphidinium_carterae.1
MLDQGRSAAELANDRAHRTPRGPVGRGQNARGWLPNTHPQAHVEPYAKRMELSALCCRAMVKHWVARMYDINLSLVTGRRSKPPPDPPQKNARTTPQKVVCFTRSGVKSTANVCNQIGGIFAISWGGVPRRALLSSAYPFKEWGQDTEDQG